MNTGNSHWKEGSHFEGREEEFSLLSIERSVGFRWKRKKKDGGLFRYEEKRK